MRSIPSRISSSSPKKYPWTLYRIAVIYSGLLSVDREASRGADNVEQWYLSID